MATSLLLRTTAVRMSANPFTPFATTNFSLSGASGLYDRARPRYPDASIKQIVSYIPPSTTKATIVELGAGTGIFSRALLKTTEAAGKLGELICVEPAEGMRAGFNAKLHAEVEEGTRSKVQIVDGAFDKIPVKDGGADLVVAAQAFHWIGHDGASAIREIARVLKPGAKLCLIWNLEDRDTAAWVAQLRDTYEVFEAGTPQYRHGYWRHIFALPEYLSLFRQPSEHKFSNTVLATEDIVVDRVLSKSFITALPDEKRAEVATGVRDIVHRGDGLVWLDKEKGIFEYPYHTDLVVLERL